MRPKTGRARAKALAAALEQWRRSVWWDRKILLGQSFDQVIEEAIRRGQQTLTLEIDCPTC